MKGLLQYFANNSQQRGVAAVLAVELLPAALLWLVLAITGNSITEHIGWFAGAAVFGLLVVRGYAKAKAYPAALKGAIITLFVTFVAYMALYLKLKQ